MTRLCFVTGLSDIDNAGNQSLKNSLRYLADSGYEIDVWSFIPERHTNLLDPRQLFGERVRFHRLRGPLVRLAYWGRALKDAVGRRRTRRVATYPMAGARTAYHAEYTLAGRLFYVAFAWCFYLPVEVFRIALWCLRNRPALFYGVNSYGALVASVLGRLFDRPVVTRFHGTTISERDLQTFRRRLWVLDEVVALRMRSDALIMTNDGTRGDRILKALKREPSRLCFWINGVDPQDLTLPPDWDAIALRENLGLAGRRVLLMVSRLALWKRVDRGIRCLAELLHRHGLRDVFLLIAGAGPERGALEELATQLGVPDAVRFLGPVPHAEIARYYAVAHAFLSLYDVSNLGNPLLEALYCGAPVVTLRDGSTDGLLEDGRNCLLVALDVIEKELPIKVRTLLEADDLRDRLGRAGRATWSEHVGTWQARMRKEEGVLRELVTREH